MLSTRMISNEKFFFSSHSPLLPSPRSITHTHTEITKSIFKKRKIFLSLEAFSIA